MVQFGPGGESETVLLGCLLNEHLRLWRSNGGALCVRPLHPSALRAYVARGLAPRTSVGTGRFREFGRLDPAGVLTIGKRQFAVELCADPDVTESLWDAAADDFQEAAVDAMARGECLVVEPAGGRAISHVSTPQVPNPHAPNPNAPNPNAYVLAVARRTPGEWFLHVEAVPAPRAPSWPEPPEGQAGWGVAAPADDEALESLGALIADAVSMWAHSPLEAVFTFAKQADGPWPPAETPYAIEQLIADMRADVEEMHTTRSLSRASELSARASADFDHTTYPVYFTGDLQSPLVLVYPNPARRAGDAPEYDGFEFDSFDEYLEIHRRFGYHRWEAGEEHPSPLEYKQIRFLRHWGIVDLAEGETRDEQRHNAAQAVDRTLQLDLIPYASAKFPRDGIPLDALAPYYERLLGVITAYPRKYVILCSPVFELLFAARIAGREDHRFRLPTSTGMSRVEYRFSNLLLELDGRTVPVGFAPNVASPGVPMDSYAQACHDRYREISAAARSTFSSPST